jgi:hypothetical protein
VIQEVGRALASLLLLRQSLRDSGPDQPKDGEDAQGNPNYVYYKLAAMGYGANGNSGAIPAKE